MAKYDPSITGALKGSIGAITYTKNKSGYYCKAKPIPTNRNTPAQAEQRGFMRDLVAAWKGDVTKAQAAAWEHGAALHRRSDWGSSYNLSGVNLFIGLNTLRLKSGLVVLWEPEVFLGSPGARNLTLGINAITGKLDITDWDENNVNLAFFLYCTDAVPQTTNYRNRPFSWFAPGEKDTVWPVVIDVNYPIGAGETYRVFWGFKLWHTTGGVATMVEGWTDGTIV
jgi:hypothetical protein